MCSNAKGRWNIDELEQFTVNEFNQFIDEIPSDVDSYTFDYDCPSDAENEVSEQNFPALSTVSPPHSIILEELNDSENNQDVAENNVEDGWESEDDIILLDLVPNIDDSNNFIWREKYYPVNKVTFHETFGPNVSDFEYPYQYFLQLFPEELIEKLVFETNQYATQNQTRQFSPVTIDELKTFLGINIIMGIKKCPSFKDYWSMQLLNRLQEEKIYSCGTIRKKRKGFARLPEVKERGQSVWKASKSGLVCVKWMDKKPILLISNFHNPQEICNVTRRAKDGSQITVNCPTLVKEYNQLMGGVDKADMLKAIYELDRIEFFFHFLDICVVNAYIIYKERAAQHSTACLTLKDFKLAVGVGLIGAESNNTSRKVRKRKSTESNFISGHMPERTTSRRCANCSTRSDPHRSKWACATCKVSLSLNEDRNCFTLYHSSN
ncbi:hypothetical protein NQ314_014198 [Rhamnusium bicolor]|uniref:PiggyBac transposable element-derived protein domain-containing protein n=1 Tax=Rhamnusium bicolor TaxID=1586634 RepID=A0AAV8X588_9CUCU|nr:hypothetical protein NQ314_014198 [Rhamnusium bicolor]